MGIKLDEQSYGSNYTPLMWAITNDLLDAVPLLIKRGADVNALSKAGNCPLYFACHYRSLKAVKFLAESPNLRYDIKCSNSYPIHWAAASCVPEILQLVIDHGAKVDALNKRGENAIADALRFAVHKPNEPEYEEDIDLLIKTLQILVKNGLNFNLPSYDGSFPILEYIISPKCNKRVLDYVFSVGIDVNLRCGTKNKETLGESILKLANPKLKEYLKEKLLVMQKSNTSAFSIKFESQQNNTQ